MRGSGQYRHRITIQSAGRTRDPATGLYSDEPTDKHTDVPAAFRSLTSREQQAAGARQSQVNVEFEIRAGLDIQPSDRIIYLGVVYEIEEPTTDPKGRIVKIKAHRGLTDG